MVVFPYIRIKQADPTSTSAIKLLELLKLEADQLAFSDDELNNVWLSKIQTRTQVSRSFLISSAKYNRPFLVSNS
jgi:hypothetical protein